MNIKPSDKTVRDLLGSKRQFVIPRFQREYSWELKHYKEFLEDMVSCLTVDNGTIFPTQYFLGTMLFVGNFTEGTEQEIQVVDGQQRLTTITILFSALSDCFKSLSENTLSEQIFSYIMTKDDNGIVRRVLKSNTSYPFFSYYIQDINKINMEKPMSEEEKCIEEAFTFLSSNLTEENLKNLLKRKYDEKYLSTISLLNILKALRDQVLNSTFVSISTTDKEQASRIFEILNAKGKHLSYIDLIKNKIFEKLDSQEPADFAEETWKALKSILNSRNENPGIATYYRHYWISKYKFCYTKSLYDDFNKLIPKNHDSYRVFLLDMLSNAKKYIEITNPRRDDYRNKKEYFWLVQSLNSINNYFNVVQVRIAILALFDAREENNIDLTDLKNAITYLENFHFSYTALLGKRSNRLESIYSPFAIAIRKSKNKIEARKIIATKLIDPLSKIFPDFEEFNDSFTQLSFSKNDNPSNMKTKYVVNKINTIYSGKDTFEDDGSIEHILAETNGVEATNIGNLILLELPLNIIAGDQDFEQKKKIYEDSRYEWISTFVEQNTDWSVAHIDNRAKQLSREYYQRVLNRTIDK